MSKALDALCMGDYRAAVRQEALRAMLTSSENLTSVESRHRAITELEAAQSRQEQQVVETPEDMHVQVRSIRQRIESMLRKALRLEKLLGSWN